MNKKREVKIFADDCWELMGELDRYLLSLQAKLLDIKKRKEQKKVNDEIKKWKLISTRLCHSYFRNVKI